MGAVAGSSVALIFIIPASFLVYIGASRSTMLILVTGLGTLAGTAIGAVVGALVNVSLWIVRWVALRREGLLMNNKPRLQFGLGILFVLTAGAAGIVAQAIAYSREPNYISASYDLPILLAGIATLTWLTWLAGRARQR